MGTAHQFLGVAGGIVLGMSLGSRTRPTSTFNELTVGDDSRAVVIRPEGMTLRRNGADRAALVVDDIGPRLVLLGTSGGIRVSFAATDAEARIVLADKGSSKQVTLIADGVTSAMTLYGPNAIQRIGAPRTVPRIALQVSNGEPALNVSRSDLPHRDVLQRP